MPTTAARPPGVESLERSEASCCLVHRAELIVLRSNGHSLGYCEQCGPCVACSSEVCFLWPA